MPYQNRVTPFGTLIADAARGLFTGNRGRIHRADGTIRRVYEVRRWIMCRLDYPRPSHAVMTPDRYTHLFFLDEATALAAGHRPCAMCIHARYRQFVAVWRDATGHTAETIDAETIDRALHHERLTTDRHKRMHAAMIDDLPDGTICLLDDPHRPLLIIGESLLAWTPGGYTARVDRPRSRSVAVLTPPTIVRMLARGYAPALHDSAAALLDRRAAG